MSAQEPQPRDEDSSERRLNERLVKIEETQRKLGPITAVVDFVTSSWVRWLGATLVVIAGNVVARWIWSLIDSPQPSP